MWPKKKFYIIKKRYLRIKINIKKWVTKGKRIYKKEDSRKDTNKSKKDRKIVLRGWKIVF